MSVRKSINKMLQKYGSAVTVKDKFGSFESKAIIQPLMYKNKMYLGGSELSAGYYDAGHYLMIAPSRDFIRDYRSTVITCGKESYTIKRSESISAGEEDLYVWAVLTTYSPPMEDDYAETAEYT